MTFGLLDTFHFLQWVDCAKNLISLIANIQFLKLILLYWGFFLTNQYFYLESLSYLTRVHCYI